VENKKDGPYFFEWLRLHGEKAYNFAYRLAGNEADARDLVQDAFLRAYEHRDRYDPSRPLDSWLLRILQNIYIDGIRRYAHKHTVSIDAPMPTGEASWDELLDDAGSDPGDAMIRRETDALVQRALNSLAVHYRTAVALSDIEGYSYEKIGEIMSCPIGTVRSRIHQGRTLMRKAFEALQRGGIPDGRA